MQNLVHFLTNLSQDPIQQEKYFQNPASVLEMTNSPVALQDELRTHELANATGACTFFDPGPDPLPDPDPIPVPPPDED
ncbi:MAG: hypothetical protein AAF614_08385 [Chloroflexota bacterium]